MPVSRKLSAEHQHTKHNLSSAELYHANYMDILHALDSYCVDAIVTDPPYGIMHISGGGKGGKWNYVRHSRAKIIGDDLPFDPSPLLAFGVPTILWGANFYSNKLPNSGWLVWDKRRGIENMEFNRSDSELAYISNNKTVKTFRHLWHGICRDTEIGQHLHPTQKPVALMKWCMDQLNVPKGATVLDPFMGSGTTGVACIQTGRKFIGIEIDQGHFNIAQSRIRAAESDMLAALRTDTISKIIDIPPPPRQLRG